MEELDLFKMFYTTIGGLGLFFLGLRYLSDSLQSIAGNLIRRLINFATSNRVLAVIVGVLVTMIVQSSSISTVMVIGLVNAGLMNLVQAVGVILGANIGTTITGWILVIKVGKYGLLLIGLGIFPMLFSKRTRFAAVGKTFVALGLIFVGLSYMSGAFKPLRSNEAFISYLAYFDAQTHLSILGCVIIGCLLTFVIQSSSAMLGITIALASTGTITFPTAAALVLGENIGTTITAMLASVGANTTARRAAFSHAIFNCCGVLVVFIFFKPYLHLVDSIVPGNPDQLSPDGSKALISAHIAMGHTLFNVTATLLALPFLKSFCALVEKLVPAKGSKEEHHLKYISTVSSNPEVDLSMAEMELENMLSVAKKIFEQTELYLKSDSHDQDIIDKINKYENIIDNINEEMTSFCLHIMEGELTLKQSVRGYAITRASKEIESVVDYCNSIAQYRYRLFRENLDFSKAAWQDVLDYFSQIKEFFEESAECVAEKSFDASSGSFTKKAEFLNDRADKMRDAHLRRMKEGICNPLPAITFSDMAVAMRRVKNHSVNLFETLEVGSDENAAVVNN